MFFIRVNVTLKWLQVLKKQRIQTYLYMLLQKLHWQGLDQHEIYLK